MSDHEYVIVECPTCATEFDAGDRPAGARIACPRCRTICRVPATEAVVAPESEAEPSPVPAGPPIAVSRRAPPQPEMVELSEPTEPAVERPPAPVCRFVEQGQARVPMSRLAVVAFVLGVLSPVPGVGLLSALLGLVAVQRTGNGRLAARGRGLAVAAVVLGIAWTLLWGAGVGVGVWAQDRIHTAQRVRLLALLNHQAAMIEAQDWAANVDAGMMGNARQLTAGWGGPFREPTYGLWHDSPLERNLTVGLAWVEGPVEGLNNLRVYEMRPQRDGSRLAAFAGDVADETGHVERVSANQFATYQAILTSASAKRAEAEKLAAQGDLDGALALLWEALYLEQEDDKAERLMLEVLMRAPATTQMDRHLELLSIHCRDHLSYSDQLQRRCSALQFERARDFAAAFTDYREAFKLGAWDDAAQMGVLRTMKASGASPLEQMEVLTQILAGYEQRPTVPAALQAEAMLTDLAIGSIETEVALQTEMRTRVRLWRDLARSLQPRYAPATLAPYMRVECLRLLLDAQALVGPPTPDTYDSESDERALALFLELLWREDTPGAARPWLAERGWAYLAEREPWSEEGYGDPARPFADMLRSLLACTLGDQPHAQEAYLAMKTSWTEAMVDQLPFEDDKTPGAIIRGLDTLLPVQGADAYQACPSLGVEFSTERAVGAAPSEPLSAWLRLDVGDAGDSAAFTAAIDQALTRERPSDAALWTASLAPGRPVVYALRVMPGEHPRFELLRTDLNASVILARWLPPLSADRVCEAVAVDARECAAKARENSALPDTLAALARSRWYLDLAVTGLSGHPSRNLEAAPLSALIDLETVRELLPVGWPVARQRLALLGTLSGTADEEGSAVAICRSGRLVIGYQPTFDPEIIIIQSVEVTP